MSDVTLVFENCEIAVIPKENISWLGLSGVTESVYFNKYSEGVLKNAAEFTIGIEHPEYDTVERCLKYQDITQIDYNGTTYHIEWPEGSTWYNPNQITEVKRGGVLVIYVNKEKVDE